MRLYKLRLLFLVILAGLAYIPHAQPVPEPENYFVDGYHGGIYGHYPMWVTRLMVDTLEKYPEWRINLEIEPETWDIVAKDDPLNYGRLKDIINNPDQNTKIEYVNPSYGQSYLYNISIESIIRQFQFGIDKLREHFPLMRLTTYSSEEPCFTSALPQVLKSFGIHNASLKNPNTCWGGYVKAYGGESLNWIGPDGTSILTVPRYNSEALVANSTWQTTAWNQSEEYVAAARKQGIRNVVGMCLQDAGWRNGLWLGQNKPGSTKYTTWRNYFSLINDKVENDDWRLSQEDIRVSLVWGAQVVQRIAQQVRMAENVLGVAEKMASLATLYKGLPFPKKDLDSAWINVLLSQHHDCWIVPYNQMGGGKTWAGHVKEWTGSSIKTGRNIIQRSLDALSENAMLFPSKRIVVYNPASIARREVISVQMQDLPPEHFSVRHGDENIPYQLIKHGDSAATLLLTAVVPPLGSTSYSVQLSPEEKSPRQKGASVRINRSGDYLMETGLYRLIVDNKNGSIKKLIAKKLKNKNFVAEQSEEFNTLRGFFYNRGKLISGFDKKPTISILKNGPLQIELQIEGEIDHNKLIQTIQLTEGGKRINFGLTIDYTGKTGIGDPYKQDGGYDAVDYKKAFYNDTSKLIVRFPLNIMNQKIFKDAPLDVTESRLDNTFYNSWDQIKNNIIFNWVDIVDSVDNYGLALLSDHVTSYSHGPSFPLSLTVQYAGVGLWGRNYNVDGATEIKYALVPHAGRWPEAGINQETIKWNQPLIVKTGNDHHDADIQLIRNIDPGLDVSAVYFKGSDLYLRIMNTGAAGNHHQVSLNCFADSLDFVELNDKVVQSYKPDGNNPVSFSCDIPLFGFKTIRLTGARTKK